MTYKPKARPKSAYDAGRAAVAGPWGETRPTPALHAQLRLINRLGLTDFQRGRRDAILDELKRRGVTPDA
jgi:hypothetical protein